MSKNFSDFNFEVIDVTVQGAPEMFVNLNGVSFNKRVVEDLGYPAFVKTMIDFHNKAFAIKVCKQNDDKAIKFVKSKEEISNVININLKSLLEILRNMMSDEWQNNKRYQIKGLFFPEERAMIFEFKTALELESVRKK